MAHGLAHARDREGAVAAGRGARGAAFLGPGRARGLFALNALLLLGLGAGAARRTPALFRAPFNPAALSAAMLALSAAGHVAGARLPSAGRCRRRPRPGAGA